MSHETFCVVTGMMPNDIKIEEAVCLFQLTKGTAIIKKYFDKNMDVR